MATNNEKPICVAAPHPMHAVSDTPIPSAQWMDKFETEPQTLVDAIRGWEAGAVRLHNYVVDRAKGRESSVTPIAGFGHLTEALVMWIDLKTQFDPRPMAEFSRLCLGARHADETGHELRHLNIKLTDAELSERVQELGTECHDLCFRMNRIALLQCEQLGEQQGETATEGQDESKDDPPDWLSELLESDYQGDAEDDSNNRQMMNELAKGDESIIDRTQRDWGEQLNCSHTAIGKTKVWEAILKLRTARKEQSRKRASTD